MMQINELPQCEPLRQLVERAREGASLIEQGMRMIYGTDEVPEGDETGAEVLLSPPVPSRGRGHFRRIKNKYGLRHYILKALPPGASESCTVIAHRVIQYGWNTAATEKAFPSSIRGHLVHSDAFVQNVDKTWSRKPGVVE